MLLEHFHFSDNLLYRLAMDSSPPSCIVLAAFNARYAHSAFGARCLLANLGDLRSRTRLLEFDIQIEPQDAVRQLLSHNPRIIAMGCYIWNIDLCTRVAAQLKAARPEITLVLGGPEISYETESQDIFHYADHIICGEGEIEFPKLCKQILYPAQRRKGAKNNGQSIDLAPLHEIREKIIHADPVDVSQMELPYAYYTDEDIAHRAIYVEASRGCPFHCEYCMSSLDPGMRYIPEDRFLDAMQKLLDRGVRVFKFVDRTFNLETEKAIRMITFFRERHRPGMMLHFEMIPQHLTDELFEEICRCPAAMLQFEIGIQTLHEEVAHRIRRPLDIEKIRINLRRLRQESKVHIHADLIAGLPGEDLKSFADGFDRLLALNPQEIQLGILKRLRGAPIDRHTRAWKMEYDTQPPYEIIQTASIPKQEILRIKRFARYWNLMVNSGQFNRTAPLIWTSTPSPFAAFMTLSDCLFEQVGTTTQLHMLQLSRFLLEYLTVNRGLPENRVGEALLKDYRSGNRPDTPAFLKVYDRPNSTIPRKPPASASPGGVARQLRHLQ